MSLGLSYLGFPPDSGLVELLLQLAETEPDAASAIQFAPGWLNAAPPGPRGGGWTRHDPAWAWCATMLKRDPDFVRRRADFGDSFDALHYLLSSRRRSGEPAVANASGHFDDLIAHAFHDGAILHPDLKGVQGIPIRMIPADVFAGIADRLERLEFADVRIHFDPARMTERDVYRMHPDAGDRYVADRLDVLERAFGEFREFFVAGRPRKESALVFLD